MNKLQKLEIQITVIFSLIVLILTVALTSFLTARSNETLRENVASMLAVNSKQLAVNIEQYFGEVENSVALLFSDEAYYGYDDTDDSRSAYAKIQAIQKIENRIIDLGVMRNYSDFGIIYENDKTVGWISQLTDAIDPEGGIYQEFASTITDKRKVDGWSTGHTDTHSRIYYVKRLNPHAIALTSFYARELGNVFKYPEELSAMTVRMIDDENSIIYSSDRSEIGTVLGDDLVALVQSGENGSRISTDYLVTTDTLHNGWRVVCSVPTAEIIHKNVQAQNDTVKMTAIVIVLMVLFSLIIFWRMSTQMDGLFDDLNEQATHDRMTGLWRKIAFQNEVTRDIETYAQRSVRCFLILDLDNFKKINDTLGHVKGDEVLVKMARIIEDTFDDGYYCGRIGGDEFAVYASFVASTATDVEALLRRKMTSLNMRFADAFQEEERICQIAVSAGALIVQNQAVETFDDMYNLADQALYESKRTGKNKVTYVQMKAGAGEGEEY